MNRRVDREDEAENQKSPYERRRQPFRWVAGYPGCCSKSKRDRDEQPCPKDRLSGGLGLGLTLATQKSGGKGLHCAVGDDPEREETADKKECLSPAFGCAIRQDGLELDRDADHEPDIARAEQEHARQGQAVHARILRPPAAPGLF